jgi:hypothetical protein
VLTIYLRAERDHVLRIKHDRVDQIGNDQRLKIAHGYKISVGDNLVLVKMEKSRCK